MFWTIIFLEQKSYIVILNSSSINLQEEVEPSKRGCQKVIWKDVYVIRCE